MLPLLVIAVFAWSFWPVRGGDFVIDDYVFLAQSRLIDNPLVAFWSNHFYEPIYFRPIGIMIWWLAAAAFGMDYAAHSLINLGLHSINVLLLHALLVQLGIRAPARLAGVVLFALLPFSFAAVLWPSNRFDLLAVSFLLPLSMAVLHYLNHGRAWALLLAAALTIAACLGKEIAFPVAAALACLVMAARQVALERRVMLFAVLGATVVLAFLYRHVLLTAPYAVVGNDVLSRMLSGTGTWLGSMPDLARAAVTDPVLPGLALVAWLAMLIALAGCTVSAIIQGWQQRRSGRHAAPSRTLSGQPWHQRILAATLMVALISILVQTPLAYNFREMLAADPLGTVTYARFYYLPMAALAVVVAVVLMRAPRTALWSASLVIAGLTLAVEQRGLSERFAAWTISEIRPMAVAASETADAASAQMRELIINDQPCVLVFLDTQHDHPWFRMFSDVTVKARARNELTWRCYVMTESTPWLFISPRDLPLSTVGLPVTASDPSGTPLEDSCWSGVRYRYRQAPGDIWSLPGARYFAWQDNHFVEVTEQVYARQREVEFHRW